MDFTIETQAAKLFAKRANGTGKNLWNDERRPRRDFMAFSVHAIPDGTWAEPNLLKVRGTWPDFFLRGRPVDLFYLCCRKMFASI